MSGSAWVSPSGVAQALRMVEGLRSKVSCWIFCSLWGFLESAVVVVDADVFGEAKTSEGNSDGGSLGALGAGGGGPAAGVAGTSRIIVLVVCPMAKEDQESVRADTTDARARGRGGMVESRRV